MPAWSWRSRVRRCPEPRRAARDTDRVDRLFDSAADGPAARPIRDRGARRQAPLAARMRPRTLDEFVGQEHLLGEGSALRAAIEHGRAALDGPLRAARDRQDDARADRRRRAADAAFEELSAVEAGRAEVRAVIDARRSTARRRPARADGPLPRRDPPLQQGPAGRAAARRRGGPGDADRRDDREPVLRGQRARCCRARRSTSCSALTAEDVEALLRRALDARRARRRDGRRRGAGVPRRAQRRRRAHRARTRSSSRPRRRAGGRARSTLARRRGRAAAPRGPLRQEPATSTTTTISAWIKATRGSDPDASLYYLAVMLEGGEDPRFIVRRMVILASEDIGNADPQALSVADRGGRGRRARRAARGALRAGAGARSTSRSRPKSNAA